MVDVFIKPCTRLSNDEYNYRESLQARAIEGIGHWSLSVSSCNKRLCTYHWLSQGLTPGTPPGICFRAQTKTFEIPGVWGKKITPISPPPGAKIKTKYLYLQKRQINLSIFAAFFALTESFQYTHFSSCHAPPPPPPPPPVWRRASSKTEPSDFLELTLQKHI